MSEHLQRTLAVCATALIVGLVFSWVLWTSLAKFNDEFLRKDFYDRSTQYPSQVIRLNDKQFAVVTVEGRRVEIYQVDEKGKLSRTSVN